MIKTLLGAVVGGTLLVGCGPPLPNLTYHEVEELTALCEQQELSVRYIYQNRVATYSGVRRVECIDKARGMNFNAKEFLPKGTF